MMLMRKSANYLRIFVALIAFILAFHVDIPQPAAEKKHIETGAMIYPGQRDLSGDIDYIKDLFDHPGFSPSSLSNSPATTEEAKVNKYTFKVRKKEDDGKVCMDIFRSGKKVRSDCSDSIGHLAVIVEPAPGTDINGDEVPEVIVDNYTGGAHCCSAYAIFSLGKNLKLIDLLYGEHSYFNFKDLDGDGKYEAIGRDWIFAYWNTSFAGSPSPEVILRWKNGKYRLAADLMKKPPPAKKELLKITAKLKKNAELDEEKPEKLQWTPEWWAVMVKLIYTGNGNLAWEFYDWTWPAPKDKSSRKESLKEKRLFLNEFKKQLKKSYYWADLKKMNGW